MYGYFTVYEKEKKKYLHIQNTDNYLKKMKERKYEK